MLRRFWSCTKSSEPHQTHRQPRLPPPPLHCHPGRPLHGRQHRQSRSHPLQFERRSRPDNRDSRCPPRVRHPVPLTPWHCGQWCHCCSCCRSLSVATQPSLVRWQDRLNSAWKRGYGGSVKGGARASLHSTVVASISGATRDNQVGPQPLLRALILTPPQPSTPAPAFHPSSFILSCCQRGVSRCDPPRLN